MATPKVTNLAFDCNDLEVMTAFWGALLDLETTLTEEDWVDLEPLGPGGLKLSFQLVPEAKQIKNRLHLDLDVPDIHQAGERVRELGGTPAGEPVENRPGFPFRVWRDPEGNEFCLCTEFRPTTEG